jgi:hypothetical protein
MATLDNFLNPMLSESLETTSNGRALLTTYEAPSAPYVQALHQGGKQKPTAIILRPSFTNSQHGAALAVAQFWHKSASNFWDAGHYTVDSEKRFRCVRDNVIAGMDKTGKGELRIVMCADPASRETFWDEDAHRHVLRNTAELVAELILAYKIKNTYLDESGLARWRKLRTRRRGGIYVLEDSGFPFQEFQNEVNAQRSLKTHI